LVRVPKNWVELLESPEKYEKYEKDPKSEAGKRTVNVPPQTPLAGAGVGVQAAHA